MENTFINKKNLAFNNLVTCVYLSAIMLLLHYTENLYNIGKYQTIHIQFILVAAEILKYLKCYLNQGKYAKRNKFNNFLKSIFTLVSMTTIFYIVAVLFGAPVFANKYETFSFAVLLTILTVLPCCLYLGVDSVSMLFTSLTLFEGDELYQRFLINIRLTIFGAWLGAVLIPLDWNKPYQVWPIPCCLGAIVGCFVSNFISFILNSLSVPSKNTRNFLL